MPAQENEASDQGFRIWLQLYEFSCLRSGPPSRFNKIPAKKRARLDFQDWVLLGKKITNSTSDARDFIQKNRKDRSQTSNLNGIGTQDEAMFHSCLLALGYLPESSANVDLLIEVFNDEFCGIGKFAIIQSLSVINSEKAVDHLVKVANHDSDRLLRELAVQGLSGDFIDNIHKVLFSDEEYLEIQRLQNAGLLRVEK